MCRANYWFSNLSAERVTSWSSTRMEERGKREIPEKIRRPAASSGTNPTYENPGVTRPGIES
ncbi:hypothetical protein PR048_028405 [Dryococelus australis]|uniref:Uncharacterized protein n=1 Tax=Dryococelus australis TaxID=614101 RepID=A0ABQ9GAG7_9NEOP|nr:hypothetical protein PR048_028405 [Dryococelus australis]